MSPENCGYSLLLGLPDDVFSIVTRSLSPKDITNLGLCCKTLYALLTTDKVWFAQCENLGIVPRHELPDWREAVSSFKALCRFLSAVGPLLGIWVHQNPELGNVVYVMPGLASVVACRIIPQELGPLGIEDGPILWAPVFEVLTDCDGSPSFFLHGREKGLDYVYPGSVRPVDRSCNVMLLEAEPTAAGGPSLSQSKSFDCEASSRRVSRSSSGLSRSHRVTGTPPVPFSRLAFSDRRKLLEIVTGHVRVKLSDPGAGPLFPPADPTALRRRASALINARRFGEGHDIRRSLEQRSDDHENSNNNNSNKRKSLGKYFRDSLNQLLRKPGAASGGGSRSGSSSKHAGLGEFLGSGEAVGLTLHASTTKLSSYRSWPNMHDSRFALYKLPLRPPGPGQELAGLWGGTFGWPPGRPTEDKPGKALFLLLISYDESEADGRRLLIATKILEGTHYVLHPNGSAMFMVSVDEPSAEPFPWEAEVRSVFPGEGIANGYGFRYPGSKPGSLFVFENGHLAFIWNESRAVLTLQRLDLQDLLRKGERVPALPPIANFSYLTKSYSNVFAGFPNSSNSLSSPRQRRQ